jgi:hypothetical protein
MKFLLNPKGEISMSDAISKVIEPYKKETHDYDSFSKLITLACIAWNTSVLPKEEQDDAINKAMEIFRENLGLDAGLGFEALGLLLELMDRKKRLFPNISRMIIEYKVIDQGNNFQIAVASTMEKKVAKE